LASQLSRAARLRLDFSPAAAHWTGRGKRDAILQTAHFSPRSSSSRGNYGTAILQKTAADDVYLTVVAPSGINRPLVGINAIAFLANGSRAPGCSVTSTAPDGVLVPSLGLGSSLCDTAVTVTVQVAIDE